jgi:hypothetical protein
MASINARCSPVLVPASTGIDVSSWVDAAVVAVGRAVLALDCWEEVCPPDCKLVQADRVTMSNPSTAGLPKVVPGWLPLLFVAGQVVLVCKIFTFVSRI